MRLISGLLAVTLMLCVAAIAGARWFGQQRAPHHPLPLPDSAGCWRGVCPLELSYNGVVERLHAHPEVTPGSVRYLDGATAAGIWSAIQFTFAPSDRAPQPMLLFTQREHYTLAHDARVSDPPLRLRDMLIMFGPPDEITRMDADVVLHYPARRLRALVRPPRLRANEVVRLNPDDPVMFIQVTRAVVTGETLAVYSRLPQAWHGIGLYQFEIE